MCISGSELSDLLEFVHSKISGVCIYRLHLQHVKAVTTLLVRAAGLEVSGVVCVVFLRSGI